MLSSVTQNFWPRIISGKQFSYQLCGSILGCSRFCIRCQLWVKYPASSKYILWFEQTWGSNRSQEGVYMLYFPL
jgi:hypothetical protein